MSSEPANANPTILNLSDLPTRKATTSKLKNTLSSATPAYLYDPFAAVPDLDFSDDSEEDDETPEPIDSQEIFGMTSTP
jgi:hypothetical protein